MAFASNNYDAFRLADSNLSGEGEPLVFQEKEIMPINDMQQGSYSSGQVTFDCKAIQSGDKFDAKASYVIIPVTHTITSSVALMDPTDVYAAYVAGLKAGDHQIINSVSVTLDGVIVVPQVNLSNIPVHWKELNEVCPDYLTTVGSSFGMAAPDNPNSIRHTDNLGEVNNDFIPTAPTLADPFPYNDGFVKRQRDRFFQTRTANPVGDASNQMRKDTFVVSTDKKTITFALYCTILLSSLHDFFNKLPLSRGLNMQITLYTHLPSKFTCTFHHETGAPSGASSITNYGFTPFMIATPHNPTSQEVTNLPTTGPKSPLQLAAPATAPYTITSDAKIGISVAGATAMSCATLYCCLVRPVASVEQEMNNNPVSKIKYNDWLQMQPSSANPIGQGKNLWTELTTSMGAIRGVLAVPHVPATANGLLQLDSWQSPFTSAGSTTAVQAYLYQLQLKVSGRSLWSDASVYQKQEYLRLALGARATNGNGYSGATSGLYGELAYRNGNGFKWMNLSRKQEGIDALAVALTLQFTNTCPRDLNLCFFIEYEREISLNTMTGKIVV